MPLPHHEFPDTRAEARRFFIWTCQPHFILPVFLAAHVGCVVTGLSLPNASEVWNGGIGRSQGVDAMGKLAFPRIFLFPPQVLMPHRILRGPVDN